MSKATLWQGNGHDNTASANVRAGRPLFAVVKCERVADLPRYQAKFTDRLWVSVHRPSSVGTEHHMTRGEGIPRTYLPTVHRARVQAASPS